MPNLIKVQCGECKHKWYASVVNGKALFPHCGQEDMVMLITEGSPGGQEKTKDKHNNYTKSSVGEFS